MEEQLHHTHGRHHHDPVHLAGTHVIGDDEHDREMKSKMKKVKEKVEKLKDTMKHGHFSHGGQEHKDEAETVNDSPVVRSGLVDPTVMGTPVLAEDLYTIHSDIVDPPVRTFAQWEEEEKHGDPPPLATTGVYGTHLTDPSPVGQHVYGQDVNKDQLKGSIGKSSGMEKDPSAPNQERTVSPTNHRSKVADPTNTGRKESGITEVLHSFDKMSIYHEPDTKSSKPDQNEPNVYTGSHDQFAPEPVENPTLDTIAKNPSNPNSSYNKKISPAMSAITGKAASVYEKVMGTFKPGDDDKVLSEVITNVFHWGKLGNVKTQDEGERRLQDSRN